MGDGLTRFITKLERNVELTPDDREALAGLCSPPRQLPARVDFASEGDPRNSLILVLNGWVCRYRTFSNGKRQLIGLLLPGDISQPFGATRQILSHSLMTLTPVSICEISPRALRAVALSHPRIEDALWLDLYLERDLASELVVSLGRRSATERLAAFFCEIYLRLSAVGLATRPAFELPMTQTDLADLLGLSSVHINRSLKELRRRGLISWRHRQVEILRLPELFELAELEPAYSLAQLTSEMGDA